MAVNLVQDIHISDVELWNTFEIYWNQGNYIAAVNLLNNNQQLVSKYVSAQWLNALTALVYQLENNSDDDFKADKIKISYVSPALTTGQIYFQIEVGDIAINVASDIIPMNSTSLTLNYSDKLINFMAFQGLDRIDTDVAITSSTVTFTTSANPEEITTCLIFYTDSSYITISTGTITTSLTSVSVNYSNTIVAMYATQSNSVVGTDITVNSGTVQFAVAATPSSAITCYVVTITTAQIGTLFNRITGSISTSVKSVEVTVNGQIINCIALQGSDVVIVDLTLNANKAIISTRDNPTSTIQYSIFYT